MNMMALASLVGTDDALDPSEILFTVKVAKSCRSCLFAGQRSSVCHQASAVAVRADLPDCDAGFVYVALAVDPRQLTID